MYVTYYLYAGEENLLLAKRMLFFGRGEVIPTPSRNSDTLRNKGLPLMPANRLGVFCLQERLVEHPAPHCCERSSPLSPSSRRRLFLPYISQYIVLRSADEVEQIVRAVHYWKLLFILHHADRTHM
jgi:hypothetical protein